MNQINTKIDKVNFINNIFPSKCPKNKYIPSILPSVPRIIVLGDIHGDYNLLIQMLKIPKLISIDSSGNIIWTGENTFVVQVGDQIDRCRPIGNMLCSNPLTTYQDEASDIKIMKLCDNLNEQAMKVGGMFISLLGNHELMNVEGNMSYVSYLNVKEFDNYVDKNNPDKKFTSGLEARTHAFAPGNEIGTMLGCSRMACIIIGSNLFVHAGIINGLIHEVGINGINDIESINIAIKLWLLGLIKKKYIKSILKASKNSMFWTRILGNIPPNVEINNSTCVNHIGKVLKLFNIGHIIIGHTPQSFTYSDDINKTCGNSVIRVDNGSSSAFHRFDQSLMSTGKVKHSRRPQVLEIINDTKYYILDGITKKELI